MLELRFYQTSTVFIIIISLQHACFSFHLLFLTTAALWYGPIVALAGFGPFKAGI